MSDNQLKILHIMSGFGGGISSFIHNKADYVRNKNIQFDVVTYDECSESFKNSINKTGGSVYTLQNPKTTSWQEFKKSYVRVLKENMYDIIYCHINGYRVLPYYYYAKKYSDASFYLHAHTTHLPKSMLTTIKRINIQLDQNINRIVTDKIVGCGSLSIRNIFGDKVSKENMMVIPNSVEINRFIKDKETSKHLRKFYRNEWQIADDELLIGHVGRLETVKNHELTIRLAKYIKENNLRMKILIIGTGNREEELKNKVSQKNINNIITFTGRISPIEDFFPALDVMLLPSFAEGLPTVVVEAQASGVPVVMSDTITEEVDLGFNMLKTVPLDSDSSYWIDAIIQTQSVTVPKKSIRKKIIKEKKFSNDASGELYVNFLKGNITQYTII
jgi:glycosyltransferase involved in cell wall biosynthesis